MCERVGNTIICARGGRKSLGLCRECWIHEATRLCDGPSAEHRGKTCDKPLCTTCARKGPTADVDYCRAHDTADKRRLAL
jgi:hypothetical protein